MISLPKDIRQVLQKTGIKKGMTVIQFGVEMRGHIVSEIQKMVGEKGKVYAIDVLPASLLSIRKFCSDRCMHHVEPVLANYEKIQGVPLPDACADLVIMIHSVWRTADLQSTLAEANRLLKPGGQLLIMDWQSDTRHPIGLLSPNKLSSLSAQRHCAASGCHQIERLIFNENHWAYLLKF
jgi:ubiquinone/menaquinone biosynthesis C-methylase UbiE